LVQSQSHLRKPNEKRSWNVDFGKFKFRTINWQEDRKLKKTILWKYPDLDVNEIKKQNNAKYFLTKHPISLYDSSIIVLLD